MIVKIQQSITVSEGPAQMLIYDKSKKVFFQEALSTEISTILGGRLKAYFDADVSGKQLVIHHEVDQQSW